ncbi:MAG: ABC transporter ATP-binding protein [Arachnia sp.]
MSDDAIEATGVCAGYRERRVLHDVSLRGRPGEWVGLLGPNGSGKSTLLGALGGAIKVAAGEVRIAGRPLATTPPRERARILATLPQSPPPPAGITVRELVLQGRHPYRGALQFSDRADAAAVAEAIALVGLRGFEDRYVERLSGGERQRAWMALTIAQSAPIVLLDEPTTFLDLGHQFELLELVEELRTARNWTVVSVLHDINQAARFADRLVVLSDGRVVADGVPSEVVTEDLLRERFGVAAAVTVDPVTGRPTCTPRASTARA